ncbi:MAG: T9SS type A sorting domain-containing protein [Bacteroidales bacterium]|nr:T9SS type A sorting domain-containing protein [Bacteroidales bacterium]
MSLTIYVPIEYVDVYNGCPWWGEYLSNNEFIGTNKCSHVTNVDDEIKSISLFPNPFRDVIYIDNFDGGYGQLKLFNLYGKEVLSTKIYQSSEIVVKDLSAGMYLYKIDFEDGNVFTGKIIKE